jgi:hypothetical protein
MRIAQVPLILLFTSVFAQEDPGDQAPEPEGEPEPQFGEYAGSMSIQFLYNNR